MGILGGTVSGLKGIWQHLRNTFTRVQGRLEKIYAYRLLKRTFLEFGDDEATDRAAAIAYYAFLSIFPLLLGLISLLGFILPSENVRQAISNAINQVLPGSSELVQENLDSIIRVRGISGGISLVLLLWSGSNLFAAVGRAINRAWDIRKGRNYFIRKLRDIGMVLATGILFLLSMGTSAAISFIDQIGNIQMNWVISLLSRIVAFLLALLVFLIIFKVMPNTRTTWGSTWPGALLTAALFEIARLGFIFYLTNFANYQMLYGSLASVIILLFWIYLSSIIVILGVEFNSELSRMRRGLKRGGKSG